MIVLFFGKYSIAQNISISTLGTPLTENYDGLSNTIGSTTNNLTITGWVLTETGGGARDNELHAVDAGGSATGDTYSYGTASSTDRALGGLRSGTLIPVFGVGYTNNSGATINSLDISYVGEQWRSGTITRIDRLDFQYSTDATSLNTGTWIDENNLDFSTPNTSATGAKDGNAIGNKTALNFTITGLTIPNGTTFWLRWNDVDATGADDGLSVDDFSLTANGLVVVQSMSIDDASLLEGNSGTTNAIFTVSLTLPAGVGGVTFDYTTSNSSAIEPTDYTTAAGQGTILENETSTTINVPIVGDVVSESNETFFVTISNASSAINISDNQGIGTIQNDDVPPTVKIHNIQGPGATAILTGAQTIEGIVIGDFQNEGGNTRLGGFFVQEEDADIDADLSTSEGIFVYQGPGISGFDVAEGDLVSVTGNVSEFNGLTEITATSIIVLSNGNSMPTASTLTFPLSTTQRETVEGMLITIPAPMTITDNYDTYYHGEMVIASNGKQLNFTEINTPSAAGYSAYVADQATKSIILDDDKNGNNNLPVYHLAANGASNLRAGSNVENLIGIMDYGFSIYRIRPIAPVVFDNTNPRPAAPMLTGNLTVATFNLLNFFNGDGMGGGFPTARGASTQALFNVQKTKIITALSQLNADIVGLEEVENDGYGSNSAIQELVNALNSVMGSGTYSFINPGTNLGTDLISVGIIYKSSKVTPIGAADYLTTPTTVFTKSRVPLAQTFTANNSCEKFTVIVNHFKSKGSPPSASDVDNFDAGDGQGHWNGIRVQTAQAVIDWVNNELKATSGSDDFIILGDINAYKKEAPIQTFEAAGYTNLITGTSYSFDGFFGSLDHMLSTPSLTTKFVDGGKWQINSDEVAQIFQYDGLFPATGPYAASDHNPTIASFTKSVASNDLALVTTLKTKVSENYLLGNNCELIAKVIPITATGGFNAEVIIEATNIDNGGTDQFAKRHYIITPIGSNGSATITLYFTQAEFDEYNTIASKKDLPLDDIDDENYKANLLIFKYTGPGATGVLTEIDPLDNNIIWNTSLSRWEVTFDINNFSEFFLTTPEQFPLPVRLLEFSVAKSGENTNSLIWRTIDQINFKGFEVQKSNDGKSFQTIGNIDAKNSILPTYYFTDYQSGSTTSYYRLKLIDIDGSIEYSELLSITNEATSVIGEFYPNPAEKYSFIEIISEKANTYTIFAYDLLGGILQKDVLELTNGIHKINYSTTNLPKGINIIRIELNGVSEYRKLVIE